MMMDRRLLFAAAWTAVSILFVAPNVARASTTTDGTGEPGLIVSEIGWAGSSKNGSDEWIELTNVSSHPIDLAGWTLEGALTLNAVLTLPAATLSPGQSYLIANYAVNDPNSLLTRAPDLVTAAVSLSNSNLQLTLKRPDGSIADQAGNGKTPLAGKTGTIVSMVRVSPIVDGTLKASWTDATNPQGMTAGTPDLGTPGFVEPWFASTPAPAAVSDETSIPPADPSVDPTETSDLPQDDAEGDSQAVTTDTPMMLVVTDPVSGADDTTDAADTADAIAALEETTTDASTPTADSGAEVNATTIEEIGLNPVPTENQLESKQTETEPITTSTTTAAVQTAFIPSAFPPGTLVVNELMPAPFASGSEWVEVFNPFNNVIPLSGWILKNARGVKTDLPSQLLGFGQLVKVPVKTGFLPNEAGKVLLIDPTGVVVDWMAYGTGDVSAPKQGDSLALDETSVWRTTTTPTPGETNAITARVSATKTTAVADETIISAGVVATIVTPIDTDDGTQFVISELYPNTTGNDLAEEFIEIKNVGTTSANLKNWSVADRNETAYVQKTSLLLQPGEAATLPRTSTHISLNNNGDVVTLKRPSGASADTCAYERAPRGQSYALIDSAWIWTVPTPDEPNVAPTPAAVTTPAAPALPPKKTAAKQTKAAVVKPVATPTQVSGIIISRSGRNVRVENKDGAFTVSLPVGTDAGALGITSGRQIEAAGLRTDKAGKITVAVQTTDAITTSDPPTAAASPTFPAQTPAAASPGHGPFVQFISTARSLLHRIFVQT